MKARVQFPFPAMLGFSLLLAIAGTSSVRAQEACDYACAGSGGDSRAQHEAEQMVSLSTEKIIQILQQEPALLLEVKKVLVRRAFEEGRVIESKELTDNSVFQIIAVDENFRVLITQEIEDRGYIQLKPSRREIEQRERVSMANALAEKDHRPGSSAVEDTETTTQPAPVQAPAPVQPEPQPPQSVDPRRLLQQAKGTADSLGGALLDQSNASAIEADQLGTLLSSRLGNSVSALSSYLGSARRPDASISNFLSSELTDSNPKVALPPADPLSDRSFAPQSASITAVPSRSSERPSLENNQESRPERTSLFHPANPYANVPSLYDLYSQYLGRPLPLERFGAAVFRNRTAPANQLAMDLPVGPDYVVGPGDALSVDLWGGVSQRLDRVVDREGRLSLPEVGSIQVTGRTLGDVQHLIETVLRTQLRGIKADVSISRLRTIRVYVVGDVERPGAYDISSLSTPLNALYQAGGPTSRGSLRVLKHYRGQQLVQTVDIYDLLLHGVRSKMESLQTGDTLLVPPIGPEVTIEGMVRRPAIYELDGENSLAQALELAGGILPSGTLRHLVVERIQAHESRTMLQVDIPDINSQASVTDALTQFQIQDGDRVKISSIVAFASKSVYLDGHVFRPGKYAFTDGMTVADLIHSYDDLLPEPYRKHAEIIRLQPPDYTPEVLAFNLEDALTSKAASPVLKPFDTVRIFGRFDFDDPPIITLTGEVRYPGDHITNGVTYLRDALYLAGNVTATAELDNAQVFRRTSDGKLKVLSVNIGKALTGDTSENILLQPQDRIFIHRNPTRSDPSKVTIKGEVVRPGSYPLGEDMTAADLIHLAGGLKRSANTEQADLTRFNVQQSDHVVSAHLDIALGKALAGQPDSDIRLHDGDLLTVGQIAGWNDIGASITVKGEVLRPGPYGIQQGERLSDVLARVGGFLPDAYPYGAILERQQVRELEERHRSELISDVEQQETSLKAAPDAAAQWKSTLQKLQAAAPLGRLVIHVSSDGKRWIHTSADIQVRDGDILFIPKRPNFVLVDGAVYNPTAITYKPGKNARWYLSQAGGPVARSDKKHIFIVRANGAVAAGKGTMFGSGALDAVLQPGDMIMVPEKPASAGGFRWRDTLQVAQLLSSVGVPVALAMGL